MLARRHFICGMALAAAFGGGSLVKPAQSQGMREAGDAPSPPDPLFRHPSLASGSRASVASAICLAIDCSFSETDEEFAIQCEATADALMPGIGDDYSPVESAIRFKSGDKAIALCVLDFSTTTRERIPWLDLRADDPNLKDKMAALSSEIRNLSRRERQGTSTFWALEFSEKLFKHCPWRVTERKMLDVYSDGISDGGVKLLQSRRDRLAKLGVTINGLAICNEFPHLDDYFRANLATIDTFTGPDGVSSQPGYVWEIARNLNPNSNTQDELVAFYENVTRALKMKICIETAGADDVGRMIGDNKLRGLSALKDLYPGRNVRQGWNTSSVPVHAFS